MYWASTYLVEVKGVTIDRAAGFASLFYIGLTVGRFLGGFIMNKLGDRKMIILGTCILSCGILCAVYSNGESNGLSGRIYRHRFWLCADLSLHYSFHAE